MMGATTASIDRAEARREDVDKQGNHEPTVTSEQLRPFLRPVRHRASEGRPGDPLPADWVAEPGGRWAGQEVEVVYDWWRYDVMFTSGTTSADDAALEAVGWERRAVDDARSFWIRNRLATTRDALARFDQAIADAGRGGRTLEGEAAHRGELVL
jgi:hypothetical protein